MALEDIELVNDLVYLDPRKVRLFKKDGDALRMTIEGDKTYLKVSVARAYPLSDPHHFVAVKIVDGPEVGVIRDIREIDQLSRHILDDELSKRYFTPVIGRFLSIRHEFGAVYFEADTDKGKKEFVVRGLRENISEIQPGRYLIVDVDGNRFELPDITRLDQKSLVMWERLV